MTGGPVGRCCGGFETCRGRGKGRWGGVKGCEGESKKSELSEMTQVNWGVDWVYVFEEGKLKQVMGHAVVSCAL